MTNTNETFDQVLFLTALRRAARASEVDRLLTPEREEQLAHLCERLLSENKRYNLTAIKEPARAALLHFVDSLTIARFIPEGARVIDIGCGGGFPSLPLAVCRPDIKILAVDATEKKVRYVAESARLLGLSNLKAAAGRAEELAAREELRESFDIATARAVAALPVLSELCLPFCRVGGAFLAMKGEAAENELREAGCAPEILGGSPFKAERLLLSNGDEVLTRYLLSSQKTRKTPAMYPRQYAKILKAPLS